MSSYTRKKGSKYCPLCLDEKVTILRTQDAESLNDRSELMTRCRHADSYMLENYFKSKRRKKNQTAPQDVTVVSPPVVVQQSEEVRDEPTAPTGDARDEQRDEVAVESRRPRRNGRVDYGRFF